MPEAAIGIGSVNDDDKGQAAGKRHSIKLGCNDQRPVTLIRTGLKPVLINFICWKRVIRRF